MFNNRFNSSKNDPLVEAVKAARADGDARRLAESMANDLFGVYSRKAVVREYLSDYDYALEEAYKCVKEEDKMADKDYDRDGKIETSKKEVWGSRLRAAKASGKYKGPVDEDSSDGLPPSDAAKQAGARQQAQTPSSTPARTGNAAGSTISNARAAAGMNEEEQIDEISTKLARSYLSKATDVGGNKRRTQGVFRARGKMTGEPYEKVNKSGITVGHVSPKVLTKEEEQIDEISKELAGKYIKHADYKRSDSSFQSGKVYGKELATKRRTKKDVEDSRKHNRDSFKREKGINTAVNKLTGRAKVAANEEVMKESIVAKLFAKHMEEQVGRVSVAPKLSAFGSAFSAARKSGQSNFSFGGKSYNTKLASPSSTPKATPSMGRTSDAAASLPSSSSSRIPSMAASTPAAKPTVGKRDFASTLGRDVGSGPDIKPDAPKPSVSKYDFGSNIIKPSTSTPPSSGSDSSTSTPASDSSSQKYNPTQSGDKASEIYGSIVNRGLNKARTSPEDLGSQINRQTTDTTADDSVASKAGAAQYSAPEKDASLKKSASSQVAESVIVGGNRYRIV